MKDSFCLVLSVSLSNWNENFLPGVMYCSKLHSLSSTMAATFVRGSAGYGMRMIWSSPM